MTEEPQFRISFADFPEEIENDALAYAASYVVGLVRFDPNDGQLMGSGTLVTIGKKSGILTARHVLDAFSKDAEIGLILPKPNQEKPHPMRPVVRMGTTQRYTFPLGAAESDGPDLAFLELALSDVAWIGARKSFRNLDKVRTEILADPCHFPGSAFIVTGFPDEQSSKLYSQDGRS